MSTPLGQIDPNRIALNQAARQRQAEINAESARIAALEAEQRRREQEEERRLEEQRRQAEERAEREARQRRSRGGGRLPSWVKAGRQKASQEDLREAHKASEFDLFRKAKAEAAEKGVDLTRATIVTRQEDDQIVSRVTRGRGTRVVSAPEPQPNPDSEPELPKVIGTEPRTGLPLTERGTVLQETLAGVKEVNPRQVVPRGMVQSTPVASGYVINRNREGKRTGAIFYTDGAIRGVEGKLEKQGQAVIGASFSDQYGEVRSIPKSFFERPQHQGADVAMYEPNRGGKTTQPKSDPYLQDQANLKVFAEAFGNVRRDAQKTRAEVTYRDIEREASRLVEGKYSEGVPVVDDREFGESLSAFYRENYSSRAQQSRRDAIGRAQGREVQALKDEMRDLGYGGAMVSINEKGQRTYSFVPLAGRPQYEYVYKDPRFPLMGKEKREIMPEVVPLAERPKAQGGFVEGFTAFGENIITTGKAVHERFVLGKDVQPQFKPELESESYEAIGKGQQYLTIGGLPVGGSVLFSRQTFNNLGQVGQRASENLPYYAGSATASLLFNVGTLGTGRLAKSAVSGARFIKSGGKIIRVEQDIIPPIQKELGQAGKIGIDKDRYIGIGTEGDSYRTSVMRPATVGKLKEPGQEVFQSYPLEAPKSELPLAKVQERLIFGKPERTTAYIQSFAKVGDVERPISALKEMPLAEFKAKVRARGADMPDPSKVAKEPVKAGGQVFDVEQGARGENIFVKAKPFEKIVATSETVTNKELAKFLQSRSNVQKFLGTSAENIGTRVKPSGRPPSTPLKFEKMVEPQVTAQFVKESLPAASIGGPSKTPDVLGSSAFAAGKFDKFLGLGGNASAYAARTGLGFGGATGAERKSRGRAVEENILLAYPPGTKERSAAKSSQHQNMIDLNITKSLDASIQKSDLFNMQKSRLDISNVFKLADMPVQRTSRKQAALSMTGLKSVALERFDLGFRQDFAFRQATMPVLAFDALFVPRFPPFKTPRIPAKPMIPFAAAPRSKKGKRRKRDLNYSEFVFPAVEIFPGTLLAKMFSFE